MSLVLALGLAAGLASPVMAGTGLTATSGRGVTTLSLDGKVFRTTGSRISNQRLHTFKGSSTVVASWDETNDRGTKGYFALSLDKGATFAQVMEAGNVVRLRYAEFDPAQGAPAVVQGMRAPAGNELYLVQFVSTPLDEMRREIAARGGVVERFLTDNTHVVRMDAAAVAQVRGLSYVRYVGAYEPAYRLSEEIQADIINGVTDPLRVSINVMRSGPAQQQAVAARIQAMGGIVEGLTPDMNRLEATLTPQQALAVAGMNEVEFVDPWGGPGGTDMDIVRQIGGANLIEAAGNFKGQGVRGEVHDTETQSAHPEWNSPNIFLQHGPAGSSGFHGSACFGINFARGVSPAARGMLPEREAGIFFWYTRSSQFTAGQPSRLSWNTESTDPNGNFRSCYQTSSVGSSQITNYSTISAEVDNYLFQVDYLSCQSQSNTGSRTSRPQAWAKNIVSVGGVTHQNTLSRADDSWTSASYGPAADNRVKPDLTHFYDSINTTNNASAYTQFSGTSGATPIVAGHFGLLHQMWHEGVWTGFGGGSSVFHSRPFSTTAKALMINGAYRYFWAAPAPAGEPVRPNMSRDKQGWGMPDLNYLYTLRNKTFIVNANQPLTNAQTRQYTVNVAAGEPKLNVTMCYIDPQGTVGAAQTRINDLSLKVTAPDGVTTYWGNSGLAGTLATPAAGSNWSTPGGSANTVDTVENVFIQNPAAGAWKVEVVGSQVVQDAYPSTTAVDAGFSLVVTGATANTTTPCYANCDGSTIPPILNVNDFVCFQIKYAAGDPTANCDGSTIPPALNVNDFICFQTLYAAGCP